MLEKIGLPAKPSMRGANWVIDASHCQGCSSQFTFINRKHHCRRCGGIFCNSCTQQRMVLRGQGDSPVRICDPCKKLEEAARFELRYGYKKRAAKAGSKQISKTEDELLGEILGADEKHFMPSRKVSDKVPVIPRTESTASSASSSATANDLGREEDSSNSIEGHHDALSVTGSNSPEDLRQQAMEEKRRYRTLKVEGKAEEALKVFKRAKELERQAGALEIAIRKNRKIAAKVSNSSSSVSIDRIDEQGVSSNKKSIPLRDKEEKDDLFSELRELGWSDADIHDAGRKPADLSLDGEFANLLGETFQKSEISKKKGSIDKSPVLALKRRALLLKREGRLAEAKEELKQAKLLEKQLEEQELLGEASDSEDELSAIINSMDDDNQDNLNLDYHLDGGANFEHLLGATDYPSFDENVEITDNDMNDPVLVAALQSFGWTEEDELVQQTESVPLSQEALQAEVLNLKKEALSQKRAGNVSEAMALLKKAKLLEQKLERVQSVAHMCPTELNQGVAQQIVAPKSKIVIQKELLALKKKALALRREGRLEEADEELKKGKLLEQQLEELENASKKPVTKSSKQIMEPNNVQDVDAESLDLGIEHVEPDVTEQDMQDPAMLSSLRNMGWEDDDESDYISTTKKVSAPSNNPSAHESVPFIMPWKLMRNKAEIQKELLSIKRKALALRRQGKTEEADEELERAKDLEKEMEEIESRQLIQQEKRCFHDVGENARIIFETEDLQRPTLPLVETINTSGKEKDASTSEFKDPKTASSDLIEADQPNEVSGKEKASNGEKVLNNQDNSETTSNKVNEINAYKDEILALKRNALVLKKEGKLKEAKEELRKAKLLEKSHEGQENITDDKPAPVSTSASSVVMRKPISSHDRFKLQQESLHHKRNALKLRREGKIQESEAEFEKAKVLENQLEELGAQASSSAPPVSDVVVEDLLDPQLMSVLKSIGWDDKDLMPQPVPKPSSQPVPNKVEIPSRVEKTHLEAQIKAEKARALNLKRAGKQDEALEALRSAKKLEKKLASLT